MTPDNKPRDWRATFVKMLSVIADLCNFEITTDIIKLYESHLAPFGYEKAAYALKNMMAELRPGAPFPSVNGIIREMGEKGVGDDGEARETAARCIGAVSKFGYTNPDRAQEYIGPLGWSLIDTLGGWVTFCDGLTSYNESNKQAQIRELAKAKIIRIRSGQDVPGLPGANSTSPQLDAAVKLALTGESS